MWNFWSHCRNKRFLTLDGNKQTDCIHQPQIDADYCVFYTEPKRMNANENDSVTKNTWVIIFKARHLFCSCENVFPPKCALLFSLFPSAPSNFFQIPLNTHFDKSANRRAHKTLNWYASRKYTYYLCRKYRLTRHFILSLPHKLCDLFHCEYLFWR